VNARTAASGPCFRVTYTNSFRKPVVHLRLDDTAAGRYGKHVSHAGWFKDASCNGPAYRGTVIHWAHNWIIGAVTLRSPA